MRENSYNSEPVPFKIHAEWFRAKLASPGCAFYLFFCDDVPAGQVRIEERGDEAVVSISIDHQFRGKSLAAEMLRIACRDFIARRSAKPIRAYIKTENIASRNAFRAAGFGQEQTLLVHHQPSVRLTFSAS